jgi:hypothetical protein
LRIEKNRNIYVKPVFDKIDVLIFFFLSTVAIIGIFNKYMTFNDILKLGLNIIYSVLFILITRI